jgi:hypothetical protein
MTDRELLQQALDALQGNWRTDESDKAIEALRARLAQPEPKPITMVVSKTGDPSVTMSWWHEPALPVGTPLYTVPPQCEWVDLTNDEIDDIWAEFNDGYGIIEETLWGYERALEAKLREKNG